VCAQSVTRKPVNGHRCLFLTVTGETVYVESNTGARSLNHCSRVEAKVIKCYEYVSVSLPSLSNAHFFAPYYTYIAVCGLSGFTLCLHALTQTAWF